MFYQAWCRQSQVKNACEDSAKATMCGSEVLKTGCSREKAGQWGGYWRGMTGHCVTHWKCMENVVYALSMHSTEPPLRMTLLD